MRGPITDEEVSAALEYQASVISAKIAGVSQYTATIRMTHLSITIYLLLQLQRKYIFFAFSVTQQDYRYWFTKAIPGRILPRWDLSCN